MEDGLGGGGRERQEQRQEKNKNKSEGKGNGKSVCGERIASHLGRAKSARRRWGTWPACRFVKNGEKAQGGCGGGMWRTYNLLDIK